jgi:hypothetical protein
MVVVHGLQQIIAVMFPGSYDLEITDRKEYERRAAASQGGLSTGLPLRIESKGEPMFLVFIAGQCYETMKFEALIGQWA